MVVWSGWGFVVIFIAGGCLLAAQFVGKAIFGADYAQNELWLGGLSLLVAAASLWPVAPRLSSGLGRVSLDKDEQKEVVVKPNHSLFFVPVRYWPAILTVLGVLLIVGGWIDQLPEPDQEGTIDRGAVYQGHSLRRTVAMRVRHLALFLALLLVSIGPPVAFAGGWAVTTLDEVPATLHADQTYPIGYTIRQHGQTPLVTSTSGIQIRNPSTGATERFAGKADGAQGHYVAQVRFPSQGEWEWTADQSPFQPQALGTISIVPRVAPAPVVVQTAPAAVETTWPTPVRLVLPMLTLLAAALFLWRLVLVVRPRQMPVAAR